MTALWGSQQWTVLGFLAITCVIELANWFTLRRMSAYDAPPRTPRVSVLVPARNEERNIERCVLSLLDQRYADYEVVVLDDGSTDGTLGILEHLAASDRRLRVLRGADLPAGWMGKHWACQQLLEASTGEYVLYVDADTWHHPMAVANGVAAMLAGRVDMLSALPQEHVGSVGELLIVPVVPWSFFALLPLLLAFHLRTPLLSSAVGQYMMFRRSALESVGGFGSVRSTAADDIGLARVIKSAGYRWRLVDGMDRVHCRMYQGFVESFKGFAKNLFAVFYHNVPLFVFIWLFVLMAYALPLVIILGWAAGIWTVAAASLRVAVGCVALATLQWGVIAIRFRLPGWLAVTWPAGQVVTVIVAFVSLFGSLVHAGRWKGRTIVSRQHPKE
jgi:chlorobactene glucosyltransferase